MNSGSFISHYFLAGESLCSTGLGLSWFCASMLVLKGKGFCPDLLRVRQNVVPHDELGKFSSKNKITSLVTLELLAHLLLWPMSIFSFLSRFCSKWCSDGPRDRIWLCPSSSDHLSDPWEVTGKVGRYSWKPPVCQARSRQGFCLVFFRVELLDGEKRILGLDNRPDNGLFDLSSNLVIVILFEPTKSHLTRSWHRVPASWPSVPVSHHPMFCVMAFEKRPTSYAPRCQQSLSRKGLRAGISHLANLSTTVETQK